MRTILLSCLFAALAAPAFAKDSGDAAFDLLSSYAPESQQTNYIKLSSAITLSDAESIDAEMTKLYGKPSITRSGLKIWEVKNKKGTGAELTTIMCGPDGKGGIIISADRRGPIANGANTKAKRKAKNQAHKQLIRLQQAQRRAAKSALHTDERD